MHFISSRPTPGFWPLILNISAKKNFLAWCRRANSCSQFGQPLATLLIKLKMKNMYPDRLRCNMHTQAYIFHLYTHKCIHTRLTYYSPVLLFYTPSENIIKPLGFLMFSGVIEKQHWAVRGQRKVIQFIFWEKVLEVLT